MEIPERDGLNRQAVHIGWLRQPGKILDTLINSQSIEM